MMIVDSHCHVHEYDEKEIQEFRGIRIVGVSLDIESSVKTLELAKKFDNIDPFAGFHPWYLHKTINRFEELRELIMSGSFAGIGEVGVDARFARSPIKEQMRVFTQICQLSVEVNLPLNVHALGEWGNVISICNRLGVRSMLLHWYTGPVELLRVIEDSGYFISINPTVVIQQRQMRILDKASPEILLTESDGPYRYRELSLSPSEIHGLIKTIAKVKGVDEEYMVTQIYKNYLRFLRG